MKIRYADLTPEQIGAAIRAFGDPKCPFCQKAKIHNYDPFCEDCLNCLPAELFQLLSEHSTFIESFHPAMGHLREHRANAAAEDESHYA